MTTVRTRRIALAAFAAAAALVPGVAARAVPPRTEVQLRAATGSMPKGVTVSPDGARLYTTNYGQIHRRNVGVYDAATLARIEEIDVPGIVVESAISSDGRTLYLSNFTRNSVQFLDLATRTVTHEVRAGRHPKIVVLSHDGRRLFAANWASRDVTEIDTQTATVTRTLAAQENPRGMAITRAGRLYVANFTSDSIEVYEGPAMETHRRLENVCRIPRHLSLAPDESRLYISCLGAGIVAVMDTSTHRITRRLYVGSGPKANDVSPDGRYVVTANYSGSSTSIIDTTDWRVRTIDIPTMDHASGVVFARTGTRYFVTGWYDDHLYAIGVNGEAPPYVARPQEVARTRQQREYHRQHPAE